MNGRVFWLAALICASAAGHAVASDDALAPPNFFVAPITTDVHRAVISDLASAYAAVNVNAAISEAEFDPAEFGEAEFERQLKKLANSDPSHLKLVLRYQFPLQIGEPSKELLRTRLEDLGRSAGFQTVSVTEISTSAQWSDVYAHAQDFEEAEGAREQIVEDQLIKAYPLRTKLSKFVVGDAGAVVEILQPIDGRQHDFPEPLQASIARAVQSMNLGPQKGKLQFRITSTSAGNDLVNKLFDPRAPVKIPPELTNPALIAALSAEAADYQPSQAMKLARELGFEGIACTHTPLGGAPEKLVGMPAPNFTLTTLGEGELELQSFVAGRPALLTFWGVACAPCCREAPHLTEMHEKYGSEFAIVAVNCYDESRDMVSRFADETKLQHPIVIGGRSIARESYHVASYPTTFWISRNGTIENYEIGFDSAEALERRIVEMLEHE